MRKIPKKLSTIKKIEKQHWDKNCGKRNIKFSSNYYTIGM